MTTKKIRKARAPKAAKQAAPKTGNGKTAITLPAVVSQPEGSVVLKIGSIEASESPTLAAAQALYIQARDNSGEGSKTYPEGTVYQGGTQIARISYNGRVWDMSDAMILDVPQASPESPAADAPAAPAQNADAEQLAPATAVTVPVALLAAALAIAPKKDNRYYLNGVYLHQIDGNIRLVASDGFRLIVLTVPRDATESKIDHAWGTKGIILPTEDMTRITKYTGKDAAVSIGYGVGHPHASITEVGGMARFAVAPVDGQYVDYVKVIGNSSETLSTEREPLETAAVAADYLKSAGIVAATLGSKHIFPFIGREKVTTIFTFSDCPGALLYIMPVRADVPALAVETLRMLGSSGMSGTLAALKAHETRTRTAANNVRLTKEARAALVAKADGYLARANDIRAAITPKLTGPSTTADAPNVAAPQDAGEEDSEGVDA